MLQVTQFTQDTYLGNIIFSARVACIDPQTWSSQLCESQRLATISEVQTNCQLIQTHEIASLFSHVVVASGRERDAKQAAKKKLGPTTQRSIYVDAVS